MKIKKLLISLLLMSDMFFVVNIIDIKPISAIVCKTSCDDVLFIGCHYTTANQSYIGVSDDGACSVGSALQIFNGLFLDASCSDASMSCKESNCSGLVALNGTDCVVTMGKNDGIGCPPGIFENFGKWDGSEGQCVQCAGDKESRICADGSSIRVDNNTWMCDLSDDSFEKGCDSSVSDPCDDKSEGDACNPPVGGKCDASGACVAVAVCNNDGTCAGAETTANCPDDCCDKGCGEGCTNTDDCITIEPDCDGACVDPACITDTDCGYWVCDSGAGYIAEDCAMGGFEDCSDIDGSDCGGGKVWSCSGNCNPACNPMFFPGGCFPAPPALPTPPCVDEFDACDCDCEVVACTANGGGCGDDGDCCSGDCSGGICVAECISVFVCTTSDCVETSPTSAETTETCVDTESCVENTVNTVDCCLKDEHCAADFVCDTETEKCVECITNADCAGTDICNDGFCQGCGEEGEDPGSAELCCVGLSYLDIDGDESFFCTSVCDPNAWFFCNPLRGTIETFVEAGETLLGFILGLIGSIALLFIIIAGVMYMTSAGNEERISSSKRILSGAVIGLMIALLAYGLLHVIMTVLGM